MLIPASSRLFLLIAWLVVVVGSVAIPQPASAQDDARSLALQAKSLLARRCFECHGANGVARKNVFVLDRARLISAKTVIPGDDKSLLLRLVETGAMPLGGPTLTEEGKIVLRKWILAGAPDWEEINTAAARREHHPRFRGYLLATSALRNFKSAALNCAGCSSCGTWPHLSKTTSSE